MCKECGQNPCHRMCPNYDEENDTFEALEHKQELEYERELEIMEELRYEECD